MEAEAAPAAHEIRATPQFWRLQTKKVGFRVQGLRSDKPGEVHMVRGFGLRVLGLMELSPQNHNKYGPLGPNSIMVV